ncbi:MAG: glycosyltransferase family 2 protein [Planctomycetota bacterium]
MISAIVVNWNGKDHLARSLPALLAQQPPPDEVLVVDNHSDDGSREFVAERWPAVRVVDAGDNRGPCRARNLGVVHARHELCLLVDNDVVLHDGALAAMRAALERRPDAAMVQARSLCGDDGARVHYDGADVHFLGVLVLHNWYRPLAEAPWPDGPVGAAIALCLLVRRQRYLDVGGFDEHLFILYEDNQLSYKVRLRGWTIWLAEGALCTHLAGTRGLSVRSAGDRYGGRRTLLHSRNRWYVLLTCLRWRTLVLTLPAQLLYGAIYAAFAHAGGNGLWWWRGKAQLVRLLPTALRARRAVQRGRVARDRDLLVGGRLTLNPGLADRGAKAAVKRWLDGGCDLWWRMVRRLCG